MPDPILVGASRVVLGEDPAPAEPIRVKDVPAVATLVGGELVWEGPDGLPAAT